MAVPLKQTLTVIRGDDFHFPFRLRKDGVPIDLTGERGIAEIRVDLQDLAPLTHFDVALEGAIGRVVLTMPAEQTIALPVDGQLHYSVRLETTTGQERQTWLQGSIKVVTLATR